jgi:hypothetical protein
MSTRSVESRLDHPAGEGRARLLRRSLLLDAVATGAAGALLLAAGPVLADRLGVPLALPRPVGLVLIAYAAAIWVVGSRPAISGPAARAAVVANALWAIGSVILVIAGPFALTGPGVAFVLAQAALVALFADLQFLALRQARAVGR